MKVVVIQYNAGNTQSVSYALERLGVNHVITDNPVEIESADKVIFPGVGEASTTMKYLKEKKLDQLIVNLKQPVLGICLGLQLLCQHSEEGDTACLGIFPVSVKKFSQDKKVPHVGWNSLTVSSTFLGKKIFEPYLYFVHSYYAETSQYTTATCEYGITFSACLQKDNFYAVQFHPEKSGTAGEKILQGFIEL